MRKMKKRENNNNNNKIRFKKEVVSQLHISSHLVTLIYNTKLFNNNEDQGRKKSTNQTPK